MSKIQLVRVDRKVFFTAQCQPEMRTASDYKMLFAVESTLPPPDSGCPASVSHFTYSECTCPAGKGPRASCKHIAAVLYALDEFSRLGFVRESATCTDRLQEWNKPHKKTANITKASEMDRGKSSLAQQCYGAEKRRRKVAATDLVDPRAFGE